VAKNKQGREFPLTQELRALLDVQRVLTDAVQKTRGAIVPHVFHRNGEPIRWFYNSWRTACRTAGFAGRIPHDFRRSAVRNLVRSGIPERVAMSMTGKNRAVFERYNIVSDGDLDAAARRLDEATVAATVTERVTLSPRLASSRSQRPSQVAEK
jgi:integrase